MTARRVARCPFSWKIAPSWTESADTRALELPWNASLGSRLAAAWAFAELPEEGDSKAEANPHISTGFVHDGAISPESNLLSATARSLPEYFLLDVRRFLREAAEARKIEKSRPLLNWPYRDALFDVSVMCEQAAAKPAHIEQKVWRSSGKAPAMALDAPQIGTPLASGVLGSAPNGVVRLM